MNLTDFSFSQIMMRIYILFRCITISTITPLSEYNAIAARGFDENRGIDQYLVPHSQAYIQLRNCEYASTQYPV